MKRNRVNRTGLGGVISLVLIYLAIIVIILIFVNQVLNDTAQDRIYQYFFLIPLGIVLPVILLAGLVLNIIRLIRESRAGKPGARYRVRLTIFFSLIAFFSSIPQAVLSLTFIGTTMNSWFSSNLEEALNGGVELALQYYTETVDSLDAYTKSELVTTVLRNYTGDPERLWQFLHEAEPRLDAFQLFDSSGTEIYFTGDESVRLSQVPSYGLRAGVLPKENLKDLSLFRGLVLYSRGGADYTAILSVVLPPQFDLKARNMTRALEAFTQYRKLQGTFLSAFVLFYLIFSFPLLLLSLLISFVLSQEIIQPIVNLEEATKRVAEGDYSFRILSRSEDDLAILIRSFNQMVSELEHSRKMVQQTEKIAAWQEIAQRLAHEIKNPLTPIKLSAQRILKKFESAPHDMEKVLRQGVTSIINEVDSLTELLQEFRDFSRLPAPYFQPVDLTSLIEEVFLIYAEHYPQVSVDISGLDRPRIVSLDQGQIKRVFSNLLKNAFESISGPGKVSISYDLVRKGNTSYLRIRIEDTGRGIAPADQNQVFNPYFTTKTGGTGLGLPIVERIVFDHKGQIWFESEEGAGSTFFIDLPLGDAS